MLSLSKQEVLDHSFVKKTLSEGFTLEALHEYTDTDGRPSYYRIRLKHNDGRKRIRPIYKDLSEKIHLGEPEFIKDQPKPLYGLSLLNQYNQAIVVIVEGEHCADILNEFFESQGELGSYVATTSGSDTSAQGADWIPLKNRRCLIWPDNDVGGEMYASHVNKIITDICTDIVVINAKSLGLPEKGDCVDWFKNNPDATITSFELLPKLKQKALIDEEHTDNKSQGLAEIVIEFVQNDFYLIHDKALEVYAVSKATGQVCKINSRYLKNLCFAKIFEMYGKALRDAAWKEAMATLSGLGRIYGSLEDVFCRVGIYKSKYYIDLCQIDSSKAIEVCPSGIWGVVETPPIKFVRYESMQPLPTPVANGNIDSLWNYCNISEADRLLVTAWLIESMRTDTPYPLLELNGEQGSAKSTTQECFRNLIDPNSCNLRSAPKNADDLFVVATSNHVVSLENVSYFSPSLQDAMCIISTKGGYAKRKLYTDSDEIILNANNPIIVNGIAPVITAQDLIDRSVTIDLPTIDKRKDISKLRCNFAEDCSLIFGGLLDIFAKSLKILPEQELPSDVNLRLYEFAKLGMAVARAQDLDPYLFIKQFLKSREEAIARTIDAMPAASAFLDWYRITNPSDQKITAGELFKRVEEYASDKQYSWPRSAKGFSDALRRAGPALRQLGIECKHLGKKGSYVYWFVGAAEKIE